MLYFEEVNLNLIDVVIELLLKFDMNFIYQDLLPVLGVEHINHNTIVYPPDCIDLIIEEILTAYYILLRTKEVFIFRLKYSLPSRFIT